MASCLLSCCVRARTITAHGCRPCTPAPAPTFSLSHPHALLLLLSYLYSHALAPLPFPSPSCSHPHPFMLLPCTFASPPAIAPMAIVVAIALHGCYLLKGMSLYQEDDHQRLTTDPTIYMPSSDGCLLGFLPYRTSIMPASHHDAIIVGPHPLVPQTPSQAAAMQQHQQQLAQQQSALGMPQTTGTPISMQQQLKKLPSALNVPQMRISSNGNLRPPATPVLTAITPSGLPSIVSNADSDQWSNQPWTDHSVDQRVGGIALVFHSCPQHLLAPPAVRYFPYAYEAKPTTPCNFNP
jgi:hypothetical protein